MKENLNPDNDVFDPSEEFLKKRVDNYEYESEEYFPLETSIPPHF